VAVRVVNGEKIIVNGFPVYLLVIVLPLKLQTTVPTCRDGKVISNNLSQKTCHIKQTTLSFRVKG
ncbi:MAG: hypothetical protein ABL876_16985, partial [Chitinophagaceae bacterium]